MDRCNVCHVEVNAVRKVGRLELCDVCLDFLKANNVAYFTALELVLEGKLLSLLHRLEEEVNEEGSVDGQEEPVVAVEEVTVRSFVPAEEPSEKAEPAEEKAAKRRKKKS